MLQTHKAMRVSVCSYSVLALVFCTSSPGQVCLGPSWLMGGLLEMAWLG